MGSQAGQSLKIGANYTAKELDSFVENTHVTLIATNENYLFSDPKRQYKVIHEVQGYFDHSKEIGGKKYIEKKAYIVEKA